MFSILSLACMESLVVSLGEEGVCWSDGTLVVSTSISAGLSVSVFSKVCKFCTRGGETFSETWLITVFCIVIVSVSSFKAEVVFCFLREFVSVVSKFFELVSPLLLLFVLLLVC